MRLTATRATIGVRVIAPRARHPLIFSTLPEAGSCCGCCCGGGGT